MTLVALVGVHPVISIAAIAAVLGPVISEPTLFAMAGTIAWGTAAAVGPISGLNVFLAGRFGVSGFDVAKRNLPYLFVVLVLALPTLALCAKLT
jgi:C4-dicarboxylate transporter